MGWDRRNWTVVAKSKSSVTYTHVDPADEGFPGTVTAFEWTNPHVYIEVDVAESQATKHWAIELGSPSILMRGGWKFNTIKKGDKITAVVSPLRNGDPGSLLNRVTLADGRMLGNGGPAVVGPGTPPPATAPSR